MVQAWNNNDKLYLKYGPDKATPAGAGELRTYGSNHEWEVKIDLTTLTSSPVVIDDNTKIPSGYRVQEIVVIGETAATSGGSATLDIGVGKRDTAGSTTLTEIDYNGFVAALAKTSYDAAGEQNTINIGSTGAGALIGTNLTDTGYITANFNTAAFTAGVVKVKIRAYRP